ncbi:APC family permease [Streptococcus cameli]
MQKLSKLDIISLVIGSVIGWGAFYLPGQKFLSQSGVMNTAIGFIIGWGLIYFIQVAYHTMIHYHNESGGEFTYVLKHLGLKHGFIAGWSLIFCYLTLIPLNASAVPLVLRSIFPNMAFGQMYRIAGYPVFLSDILLSSLVIGVFYYINQRGLTFSMNFQKVLMLLLFVLVIGLTLIMVKLGDAIQFRVSYLDSYQFSWKEIVPVLSIIPFLFVGFDIVPQVLTDIGFDRRFATRMTILATGIGVLIYNSLNLLTAFAYSPDQALQKEWASGQAVLEHLGILGFLALAIALLAAITGGINGFMIGSSRVVVALAEKELLPNRFQEKNAQSVPSKALAFVSVISILMPLLGRMVILYIVDISSLMAALIYAYVAFISSRLAKSKKERFFNRMALVIAILFLLLLLIPGSPSQLSPISFGILGIWILFGFIYFKKRNTKEKI